MYIDTRLLPQLGLSSPECSVEVPLGGKKSCLRLVKGKNGKGYVVRAFPKNKRKEAYQLYSADDLLERNKVPAPRLVDFAEEFSSRNVTFVTEEYLEGKNWKELELNEVLVRKLGTLLARLHRVESDHWGPITRDKSPGGSFGNSRLKRVKNRLRRVKKFAPHTISKEEFRGVREWFRAFRIRLDGLERFELIHDKINHGNILYQEEKGDLYLLDFATLQYGCRAKDVIQAECGLLQDNDELIKEFREEYFSAFPEPVKEQFGKLANFYRGYYHLSRSASNIRHDYISRTKRHQFKTNFYDQFLHHWRTLWKIIEGAGENAPRA